MYSSDQLIESMNSYLDNTEALLSIDLLDDDDFEEISVARWVASELMQLFYDKPFEDPLDVIEDFAFRMMVYRACAEQKSSERVFAIAAEAALGWRDILNDEIA